MIKEPRLRFTEEERADPALEKPIRKAEKAAAKADKTQAKIPKKQVKRAEVDPCLLYTSLWRNTQRNSTAESAVKSIRPSRRNWMSAVEKSKGSKETSPK